MPRPSPIDIRDRLANKLLSLKGLKVVYKSTRAGTTTSILRCAKEKGLKVAVFFPLNSIPNQLEKSEKIKSKNINLITLGSNFKECKELDGYIRQKVIDYNRLKEENEEDTEFIDDSIKTFKERKKFIFTLPPECRKSLNNKEVKKECSFKAKYERILSGDFDVLATTYQKLNYIKPKILDAIIKHCDVVLFDEVDYAIEENSRTSDIFLKDLDYDAFKGVKIRGIPFNDYIKNLYNDLTKFILEKSSKRKISKINYEIDLWKLVYWFTKQIKTDIENMPETDDFKKLDSSIKKLIRNPFFENKQVQNLKWKETSQLLENYALSMNSSAKFELLSKMLDIISEEYFIVKKSENNEISLQSIKVENEFYPEIIAKFVNSKKLVIMASAHIPDSLFYHENLSKLGINQNIFLWGDPCSTNLCQLIIADTGKRDGMEYTLSNKEKKEELYNFLVSFDGKETAIVTPTAIKKGKKINSIKKNGILVRVLEEAQILFNFINRANWKIPAGQIFHYRDEASAGVELIDRKTKEELKGVNTLISFGMPFIPQKAYIYNSFIKDNSTFKDILSQHKLIKNLGLIYAGFINHLKVEDNQNNAFIQMIGRIKGKEGKGLITPKSGGLNINPIKSYVICLGAKKESVQRFLKGTVDYPPIVQPLIQGELFNEAKIMIKIHKETPLTRWQLESQNEDFTKLNPQKIKDNIEAYLPVLSRIVSLVRKNHKIPLKETYNNRPQDKDRFLKAIELYPDILRAMKVKIIKGNRGISLIKTKKTLKLELLEEGYDVFSDEEYI